MLWSHAGWRICCHSLTHSSANQSLSASKLEKWGRRCQIRRRLSCTFFSICPFSQPDAGLQSLLRANSYVVVLLDVNLRGRSGLDVLPSIRAEWSRLPIIVLSMYPAEQYALRAFEVGASGYVAKDIDSKVLVLAISARPRPADATSWPSSPATRSPPSRAGSAARQTLAA